MKKIENFILKSETGCNIISGSVRYKHNFDFLGKNFNGSSYLSLKNKNDNSENFDEDESDEDSIKLDEDLINILKDLNEVIYKESKKVKKVFQGFLIKKFFEPKESSELQIILDNEVFIFQFDEFNSSGYKPMNDLVIKFSKKLYDHIQKEIV